MSSTLRSAEIVPFLVVFGMAVALASCESPGSVGSGLSDSKAQVQVVRDTIEVVDTTGFNSFSGRYAYFSAGGFSDPLFGDLAATGLVKPSLPSPDDSLEENATMKMRIIFDSQNVYGDTLANQSFEIYRITEYWRDKAIKLKDNLTLDESQSLATFTVEQEDSLDVPLDPAWVSNYYRKYAESDDANADSVYANEVHGLALVPTGSNKIIPLDAQSTRFVIENPETDTFQVASSQWAYQLKRQNEPATAEGKAAVYNMLEQILHFQLDISDVDITGPSIAKAELVFHQDELMMEQSVSGSVRRARSRSAQLHFVSPEQTPDNLIAGTPVSTGIYSEEDQAFHFNVTAFMQNAFINGFPENRKFYLMLPADGAVRASLLTIDPDSINAPELVITYLNNSTD
ncbi:hypothetical protein SAMN06265218_11533 [Fodinibius sediminis]|uniref:Uncharacterized protein n=2 Tax=Fodinibius sediminis TaxID=1214077 RepID=A0A521ED36_9BACT|nr:hypothetical protein SAMN06265218_11533 [Fodinibius sediminis]